MYAMFGATGDLLANPTSTAFTFGLPVRCCNGSGVTPAGNLTSAGEELSTKTLMILLMEETLHHLTCMNPCKYWEKLPTSTA